ncbi:MAG: hypothetical protein NW223_12065 [Hyphomicrobiaceae bacterium]|nr:hypothetical protein [Hyphomicrobiaceae bacterium]
MIFVAGALLLALFAAVVGSVGIDRAEPAVRSVEVIKGSKL